MCVAISTAVRRVLHVAAMTTLLYSSTCVLRAAAQCDYTWLPAPQNCSGVPFLPNQGHACEALFDALPTSAADVDSDFDIGGPQTGVGDWAAPQATAPMVVYNYTTPQMFDTVCYQQPLKWCQKAAWLAVAFVNGTTAVEGTNTNISLPRDDALHCHLLGTRLTAISVTVVVGKYLMQPCNTGGRTLTFADSSCFAPLYPKSQPAVDPMTYESAWLHRCPLALPSLSAVPNGSTTTVRSVMAQDGYGFSGILRDTAPVNIGGIGGADTTLLSRSIVVPEPDSTRASYHNAVHYNGSIYLVPYFASAVVKVDVVTGNSTIFSNWPVGMNGGRQAKFLGAVADAGYIWLVPLNAIYPVRVSAEVGNMTAAMSWPAQVSAGDLNKFSGGVSDGVSMWMIPNDAKAVVRLFYDDLTMVAYDGWPGTAMDDRFSGGVLAHGCLWLVPHAEKTFFCLHVATGVFYDATARLWGAIADVPQRPNTEMYVGGSFDGERLWLVPRTTHPAVAITFSLPPEADDYSSHPTSSSSSSTSVSGDDPAKLIEGMNVTTFDAGTDRKFAGASDGSTIWIGPSSKRQPSYCNAEGLPTIPSRSCAEYDDSVVRAVGTSTSSDNPFRGVVYDGSTVWFIPNDANSLLGIGNASRAPSRLDTMAEVRRQCGAAACDGLDPVVDAFGGSRQIRGGDSNENVEASDASSSPPLLLQTGLSVSGLLPREQVASINVAAPHMTALTDWPSPRVPPLKQKKFGGAAVMDGWLFLAPRAVPVVVAVNTKTGKMIEYARWPDTYRCNVDCFSGVVADAGAVWLVPQTSDQVIRLDPKTGEMVGLTNWPPNMKASTSNFQGGASDGASLFLAPFNANAVGRVRFADRSISALRPWPKDFNAYVSQKFVGGVITRNATLWLIPFHAPRVVLVDTRTGEGRYLEPALPQGSTFHEFRGAAVKDLPGGGDQLVIFMPRGNMDVIAVSAATGEERGRLKVAESARQFAGGAFDGSSVWLAPAASPTVQVVNVSDTGALTLGPLHSVPAAAISEWDHLKFEGAVFDGTAVWFIPFHSPAVLRMGCGPLQRDDDDSPTTTQGCPGPARIVPLSEARRACLSHHEVTSMSGGTTGGGQSPVRPTATRTRTSAVTRSASTSSERPMGNVTPTPEHTPSLVAVPPDDRRVTPTVDESSLSPSRTLGTGYVPSNTLSATVDEVQPPLLVTASDSMGDPVAAALRDERDSDASRVVRVVAPVAAGTAVIAAVVSPSMAARVPAFAGVSRARRCGSAALADEVEDDDAAFWEFPIQPAALVAWAGHAAVAGAVVNVGATAAVGTLAAATALVRSARPAHGYAAVVAGLFVAYFTPTAGTAVAAGTVADSNASSGAVAVVVIVAGVTVAVLWRLVWQQRAVEPGAAAATVEASPSDAPLWDVIVPRTHRRQHHVVGDTTEAGGVIGRLRESHALRRCVFFIEVLSGALAALLGTAAGAAKTGCLPLGLALMAGPGLGAIAFHAVLRPFGPDAVIDTVFAVVAAALVFAQGALVLFGALGTLAAADVDEYGTWVEIVASGAFFAQPFAALGHAWWTGGLCWNRDHTQDHDDGAVAQPQVNSDIAVVAGVGGDAQDAPLLDKVPALDASGTSLGNPHSSRHHNPLMAAQPAAS